MSDLFYLNEAQLNLIKPFFPRSHGVARVDDLRVISGEMPPKNMAHTKPCTIGLCDGAGWGFSTKSFLNLQLVMVFLNNFRLMQHTLKHTAPQPVC